MAQQLTPNTISHLLSSGSLEATKPIVQVLEVKEVPNSGPAAKRFRLVLSDGQFYHQAMLATQNNHQVESGKISTGVIIRIDEALCNSVNDKRLLIILSAEPVASPQAQIGNPVNYEQAGGAPSHTAIKPDPAAAPQAYKPTAAAAAAAPARPTSAYAASLTGSMAQGRHANIVPISVLTPYMPRWTIKARCTNKGPIRTWSNARGNGSLFSIDLLDEEGGEIRATFFNDETRYHDIINTDGVYYISNAQVKPAAKKFNTTNHNYELSMRANSLVEPCTEDDSNIPKVKYSFVRFSEIEQVAPNSFVDIIGVVTHVAELTSVTSKTKNEQIPKRDITLVDNSGDKESAVQISLTLWGERAESFDAPDNPVIAIKTCRVSDFNGRSLSTSSSSSFELNPVDLPEAAHLRFWYDNSGSTMTARSVSAGNTGNAWGRTPMMSFSELQEKGPAMGADGTAQLWLRNSSFVSNLNPARTMWYQACPSDSCNKKVTPDGTGSFFCESCNSPYPNCQYRYIMRFGASDATAQQYLQVFNDQGVQLMGKTADELQQLQENDPTAFEDYVKSRLFTRWNMRVKASNETWDGQVRLRATAVEMRAVNFVEDSKDLLQQIAALS